MSNLTVSYVSQTPAGTPAGATAAVPATDSPLGFLAALLDQILAAGQEAATGNTAEAGAGVDVPGLLNIALQDKTEITPQKGGLPSDLLASLVAGLDKIAGHAEAGDAPAEGQLPKLADAVDALIAVIDKAVAAPATPQAPATDVAVAAPAATAEVAAPAPTISDAQINQMLASLGLVPPAATPDKPVAVTTKVEPPDIAALRDRLTALAQSVAATAPDLAQRLQTLVAKLEPVAADPALAAQIGLTAPSPAPDADTLTIAHIIKSLLGHAPALPTDAPQQSTESAKTEPAAAPANPAPQVHDDLLQVLATLGLNTPPATATAPSATPEPTAAVTATTAIPPDLLRLSTQLTQVSAALTETAPDLAKKIEAVATRLVSTDAGPDLLAKLTSSASEPSGTALDKLVQSLVEAKPVTALSPAPAAPQIAAPSPMPVPAPIAPKQSKSAVAEVKAAPPEPAPVTADSAPKPAPSVSLATALRESASVPAPEPKVEAKVAAVVADATKSDPTAPPAQPQPQQAAANAQQARPLPAAYQPVANPINMGQVAFEMVRQVHQGTSRFTIRLDPPEMGRVDVRMHVDASGAVNARLTVDRAETLDLFQRDRQSLERALTQAGIDAGKTNLEFSLRQNNSHNPFAGMMGGDQRQQQPGYGAPRFAVASDDAAALPAVTLYRGTASAGGVNIFA